MAVVRAMTITYGAQVIPGTVAGANVTLINVHKLRKDTADDTFELEFDLLVDGLGSASTLAAAALALEITFNTRRLALSVDLGGNNSLTIDDADNSGFDVSPSIEKVGDLDPPDRFDSNTSRMYRVRITAGVPSVGTANRRVFGYDVSFTPSRRTSITVDGTYTATLGGAGAEATYLALIDARVATITAGLGGVYELVTESYKPDDQDQVVIFSRVYKEILFNQSTAVVDNPAIVDPNLVIERGEVTDEGEGTGDPLLTLEAQYDTSVDVTVNNNLVNVWDNICLPFVAQQLEAVAGGGVAITSISPRFDFYRHTISATVRAQAVSQGNLLSETVETLDEVDYGKIIREVWPTSPEVPDDEEVESPTPTPAHVYQAARVITRQVTTITEEVTGGAANQSMNRNARSGVQEEVAAEPVGDSTFVTVRMTRSMKSKRKTRGIRGQGDQIPVLQRTKVETFRIIVAVQDGAGAVAQFGGPGVGAGAVGLGLDPNLGGSGGRAS